MKHVEARMRRKPAVNGQALVGPLSGTEIICNITGYHKMPLKVAIFTAEE